MSKFLEEKITEALKEVFDPEIPVNVFDLGLIYTISVDDNAKATIIMTLTNPNCPVADSLPNEVCNKAKEVEGIKDAFIELVFEPIWTQDRMSDEAKLELGLL